MKKNDFNIRDFFANIFLVLISSAVAFAIIDRVSIPFLNHRKPSIEKTFSVQDIRRPSPYIMFKGAPQAKAWKLFSPTKGLQDKILNKMGYPGEAPKMPKPVHEYRIMVLGGSSVFMGNPPIPRLIQYQFEKNQCDDVKVYNFGVVSSVTSMELARLIYEVVDYAPDLVVSYSGFNDMDEPFVADPRPGYPFNYFIYESNPILDSDIREYPLLPLVAYGSNLMRNFFPNYFLGEFADIDSLRKKTDYGTLEWREKIADIYIENLVKSHKISDAFDAQFMAFFQPSLYFKDTLSPEEKSHLNTDRMNSTLALRQIIRNKMSKIKAKEEIYYVDLTDFFDSHPETVFSDRIHLTYQYRPVIAEEIYEYILRYLKNNNDSYGLSAACIGE